MSRAHANIVAGEGDESDSDDEDWLDDVDVAELTAEDIRAAGLESPFVTPHVTPKAEASNTTFGGNAVPAEVARGRRGRESAPAPSPGTTRGRGERTRARCIRTRAHPKTDPAGSPRRLGPEHRRATETGGAHRRWEEGDVREARVGA